MKYSVQLVKYSFQLVNTEVKFLISVIRDENKEADPDGTVMKGLLEKIKSMGITYFFGKINPTTDKVSRLI